MRDLQKLLKQFKLDGYLVPKNDEYFNEYINPSDDRLRFVTNFTGSAGFSVILNKKKYLFVDGRYTAQAKLQVGKKFKVITIPNKLPRNVLKFKRRLIVGFDPKLHTEHQLNFLFKRTNISLKPIRQNLIDVIWKKKPKDKVKPFFLIKNKYAGKTFQKKIYDLKKILFKKNLDILLVTAPENVAWLLNLRGFDTSYSPIPNCRLLINKNGNILLYANPKKVNKINNKLKGVIFRNESSLEKDLSNLNKRKILLDLFSCSIFFKDILKKKNYLYLKIDPIYFMKSIKNKYEINNIKKSHLIDGVALTKFLIWLKKNFKKNKISEIYAQNKLESFRKKNPMYKFPSFDTISGSGPNSSIIHYRATNKSNRILKQGDLYLVDSGGQYSFGTTDVTRTISLGNNSNHIKEIFTRVLKGHIAVSNFKIKKNSSGAEVDKKARKFLNQINLDYPHGTGHGVGYFLNVHEGPQSLSKNNKIHLKNGMILSNEPGYYKEGNFGIRIENLVYIKNNKFKELTFSPIEKDLIDKNFLTKSEIDWINNYHKIVKNNLFKFMSQSEKKELNKACLPI